MIKNLLLLFLVFNLLTSCKEKTDSSDNITWIGGQIINPKLDYIIFEQGKDVMDTVRLDSNNFFLFRADKMKEGLYILRHNETQVFYIEPGDSLLLHLNTMEFDESLAYSGKGGAKNSLLMELYLRNERENNLLPKWYTLPPNEFIKKIDSIKAMKERDFNEFISKNEVSSGFKDVAISSIKYDYFSKKELYAMANRNRPEPLDEKFFDHRNRINFNKEELRFYYPYYRFLNRYFNSVTASKYPPGTDRNSYEFSVDKMKTINSTVSNDSIRNSLLRYTAFRYLFKANEPTEENKFFELFSEFNNNPKHLEAIGKLAEATIKLSKGEAIPNVALLSMDNSVTHLHHIIKRPTVLYFWTASSLQQAKMVHKRSAELKSKFPEYDFISINTDNHFKKWRNTVKNLGFNHEEEFQLENVGEAEKELVLSSMSKAMIIDKNSVILDGNTNMFNSNFEELLLGFLNR